MKSLRLDSFVSHHLLYLGRRLRGISCLQLPVLEANVRTYHEYPAHYYTQRLYHSKLNKVDAGFAVQSFRTSSASWTGRSFVWSTKPSSTRSISQLLDSPSDLSTVSDEELIEMRLNLHSKCGDRNKTEESLLANIDQECIRRAASWDFTTFLNFLRQYALTCDGLDKSSFMLYSLNRRINGALQAPLPALLEYLRIMNNAKLWFKFNNRKHKLVDMFGAYFHQLSWNEIDVFLEPLSIQHCVLLNDKLMKDICRKVIADFDDVNNATMTKLFRLFHSRTAYPKNFLFITPWLLHILDSFVARINSFDFECMMCAGQLCTEMFIHDPRILQPIAETLLQRLGDLEPSQVATAVSVLTFFNFQLDSRDLYSEVVEALETDELFAKFANKPRSLMKTLSSLSLVGAYSHSYLDLVFSDQFLRRLLGKKINRYRVTPELLILHGGTAIECPNYAGNRLESTLFEHCMLQRTQELPKILEMHWPVKKGPSGSRSSSLNAPRDISTFNRMLYCTRGLLDEMFGGVECTHVCYLLPQFKRATVIFGLDGEGRALRIPQEFRRQQILGHQLLNSGEHWFAVSFKSRNIYTDKDPILMGADIAKDRQLRLCGFKVISITQHGWLKMSIEDKLNILKDEIARESRVDVNVSAIPT